MAGFRKVKHYILIVAAVVCFTAACLTAALSLVSKAQEGLQSFSEELAAITEQTRSAVVSVFVEEHDVDPPRRGHLGEFLASGRISQRKE